MDKIKKLPDVGDWQLLIDKINELIESHNKLQDEFVNHYHHLGTPLDGPQQLKKAEDG